LAGASGQQQASDAVKKLQQTISSGSVNQKDLLLIQQNLEFTLESLTLSGQVVPENFIRSLNYSLFKTFFGNNFSQAAFTQNQGEIKQLFD